MAVMAEKKHIHLALMECQCQNLQAILILFLGLSRAGIFHAEDKKKTPGGPWGLLSQESA
jgi:hypothetical protein